jgi:hypothetical protein
VAVPLRRSGPEALRNPSTEFTSKITVPAGLVKTRSSVGTIPKAPAHSTRWWLSGRGVDEEKLVILQTWTGNPAAGCQDEVHAAMKG